MRRIGWAVLLVGALAALSAVACSSSPTGGDLATDGPEVARFSFLASPTEADQHATVDVLNTRFAAAGLDARADLVDDAVVVRSTGSTPPTSDQVRAVASPGALQFRPVLEVLPPTATTSVPSDDADPGAPSDMPELDGTGAVVAIYRLGPTLLDGRAIESASAAPDIRGKWEILPVLKAGSDGIVKFNAIAALCSPPSASCPTGQLAVTIDGRVLTAPTVQTAEFERDQITISGAYDEQGANTIAVLLDSGALPAPLQLDGA